MTTPTDLQTAIAALPWTNLSGQITGAEMQTLLNDCVAVFQSMGGTVWPTTNAPSSGLGNNGDYAIDQPNKFLYGPKAAGAWPAGTAFGGGGGTGMPVVTSIAALQALATSTGTVYLSALGRSGTFAWNAANLSAFVTADTQKGIYVPPASAPTGASGAWVRQYSGAAKDLIWFNAIPDGNTTDPFGLLGTGPTIVAGTDNSVAMYGWATLAQYEASLGIEQVLEPSASIPGVAGCTGQYNFSSAGASGNAKFMFAALARFTLDGKFAVTFQNTYNASISGANFGLSAPIPMAYWGTSTGYLINQTVPGTSTVTCQTIADAANFSVGSDIMLAGLDTQMNGAPINPYYYEYHKVTGVNLTTGVITYSEAIQYLLRTDWPDFNLSGAPYICGKARIFNMSTTGQWAVKHRYIGMTFNLPPGGGQTYATLLGESFYLEDCIMPGPSESLTKKVVHVRTKAMTPGETDKCIGELTHYDCDFSVSGIGFQSATPFKAFGGVYRSVSGYGRKALFKRSKILTIQAGCQYGYCESASFEDCEIFGRTSSLQDAMDGAILMPIDGTNVAYSVIAGVGTFTLKKSLGFTLSGYNVVPGMLIGFMAVQSNTGYNNFFPGNTGLGIITTYTEDTNNLYIGTTLSQSAVPAFCNGNALLFKVGQVRFKNCHGTRYVRQASEADVNGRPPINYYRYLFGGIYAAGNNILTGGILSQITVNVINKTTSSGDTVTIDLLTADGTTFVTDTGGVAIKINCGVAGKRVINQTAFTGSAGTDSVTVGSGGASVQPLPANRINWIECTITFSNPPATEQGGGLIEVIMEWDTGLAGKVVPDDLLNSSVALQMQGNAP